MPFYDIQYSFPLSPSQRDLLAQNLTNLHTTTFSTPSLFVNIRLSPLSENEYYYSGSQRRINTNRIFIHVRSGGGRSDEVFAKLAADVEGIWDEVVGKEDEEVGARKALQAVFIVPGVVARESGFAIPEAGQEAAWLGKNWAKFQARVEAGDEDMRNLVAEVERRPELLQGAEKDVSVLEVGVLGF